MTLLEVRNVHLAIGGVELIRDLSFSIDTAQRLGLIGESGSGKSLAALAIMGLLPYRSTVSGSIRLSDQELVGLDERRYSKLRGDRIAMIFQEPMTSLNPLMRIGKQIGEVLRIHEGLSRPASYAQATALLERVGFDQPAQQARAFPHQLSGGQRQRVSIARALAPRPTTLVADEAVSALDVSVRAQVLNVIARLVQELGLTLVFISHDMSVVRHISSRVVVLYRGAIVEDNKTEVVFTNPQHPYTRALLAAIPRLR